MNKELLEKLLNRALDKGATFCDLFFEEKTIKKYVLSDSRIDKVDSCIINGIGIRISDGDAILHSSTNNLDKKYIINKIDELNQLFNKERKLPLVKLGEEKEYHKEIAIDHDKFPSNKKKEYLYNIDKLARSKSDKVVQVDAMFYETKQKVTIVDSLGKYVKDTRNLTRLFITVVTEENGNLASSYVTFGNSGGYELLDTIDIEKEVSSLVDITCKKLSAKPCPGGDMPVIIGPGFGAVILHEACGHAFEATGVAKGLSVLCGKKGTKIANSKVTVIDNGTIENEWGSTEVDDEGNPTQNNVLIKDGVLNSYLVDYLNCKKMNHPVTGSSRRQNYHYVPTSRLNNTYLQKGNDSIDDMIKSIPYGLYAKKMNGGSVDPITGDFNFSSTEAYMIRNGEIAEMVKDVSLIGNTLDILNQIVMISDDLSLDTGWCGSKSGSVPVCCGQPTIKVEKILVGGEKHD